jgi:isoleucyl-tRNA synthetase
MSSLYLDIIKDRLYTMPAGSKDRRSAQTVMYETLSALVRLLVPILAFTTEEIWRHMPGTGRLEQRPTGRDAEAAEEYKTMTGPEMGNGCCRARRVPGSSSQPAGQFDRNSLRLR